MTEPLSYLPKMLGAIDAIFHNGTQEVAQAIADWAEPLILEGNTTYIGLANRVFIQGNGFSQTVSSQDYVYHDDDGFHVVPKGSFELIYGPSGGV